MQPGPAERRAAVTSSTALVQAPSTEASIPVVRWTTKTEARLPP